MSIGKFYPASRQNLHILLTLAALAAPFTALADPAPAVPAPASPVPASPAPATPAPAAPTQAPADQPPAADDSTIKTTDIAARTVIQTHGAASWEEGYARINEALAKLRAAAQKAGLKEAGRPQAAFTETDDAGFKYDAMLPVDAPADAKPTLAAEFVLTQSPSGKAIKFQHRGAYDDIDSTYEAITAYLDEKGLEARNIFVEDYLNDAKDSTDMALQVDIYVFLK
jgi:effector-binding domain-containing protein